MRERNRVLPGRKYRVAVVGGAGTWGRHYLRAYFNHPDCEIVALVDRARDRRQAFADCHDIKVVYDTIDDLLAKDIPDIISLILPVAYNPDAVISCAEAGVKVVSCEKPIAVALTQADEMVRICRERGTVFGCGSVYSGVPYTAGNYRLDWDREHWPAYRCRYPRWATAGGIRRRMRLTDPDVTAHRDGRGMG